MQKLAIHSVPRSGSTWLGNIFNSHPEVCFRHQPLFSYAFKDFLSPVSTQKEIDLFFDSIAESADAFINQKEGIDKGFIPVFQKNKTFTHCCYKEVRYHHILENLLQRSPDVKIILLIRNPLATIYSWYKAPKEFRPEKGWVLEEEWLHSSKKNLNKPEEYNGYAKWKEATLLFLEMKKQFPGRVELVQYKNLLHQTEIVVKELFDFSGLDLPEQTIAFIKESKQRDLKDAYAVFKSKTKDDNWKDLPEHIIDYIYNDLKGTRLEMYLD